MKALIDEKVCNQCGETKPLSAYYPHKDCVGGVQGTCKECRRSQNKQWQAANRARRQHAEKDRARTRKQEYVIRRGSKCYDCEGKYPDCVYEFHHLDPESKEVNPSVAFKRPKWESELDKCVMLCANCHRIRHMEMRDESFD